MDEDTVKEFTRKWLMEKQNVSEILPEQLLFKPSEKLVSDMNLRGIIPDFITKNDSNEVQQIIECKKEISQDNEILAKVLAHNICVLIQEIFLNKINVDFDFHAKQYIAQN